MTRVLWFGDAAHTGFGTVTWDLGTRLLALGLDMRFVSQNQTGEPIPAPLGERTWDARAVDVVGILRSGFRDGWRPEICIILSDFNGARFALGGAHPQVMAAFADIPSYHYCPIEGVELPPRWAEFWRVLRPIAMSEFGAGEMAKVVGYRPPVIPHGVDIETFHPVSLAWPGYWRGRPVTSKAGAKRALGSSEDRVLVLRTDRHMPRKQHNLLIRAMLPVFEVEPTVDLVLHCRPLDQGGDLLDAISKLPVEHRDRVKLTRGHDTFRGLDRAELNVLYNAADIYASNSAEGFGLTIAEALAAGVPAVGLDYSAVPEVIGPAGVLVPVAHLVDNEYDHRWAAADESALTEAILRLVRKPQHRRALGSRGPSHIAAHFTWDRAAESFRSLIETAIERPRLEAVG